MMAHQMETKLQLLQFKNKHSLALTVPVKKVFTSTDPKDLNKILSSFGVAPNHVDFLFDLDYITWYQKKQQLLNSSGNMLIIHQPAVKVKGQNIHDFKYVTIHHWTVLYFNGINSIFYDSYGIPLEDYYQFNQLQVIDPEFVMNVKQPTAYRQYQDINTAVCGEYCIYFYLSGNKNVMNMKQNDISFLDNELKALEAPIRKVFYVANIFKEIDNLQLGKNDSYIVDVIN